MSLKTLIIGLGQVGMGYDLLLDNSQYVLTHARAVEQHPAFRLVGGVDVLSQNCEIFEKNFHCPSFSTLEIALKKTKAEVVIISVPTSQHAETIRKILSQSAPMAILCEKPLAYDLIEAQEIVDLCYKNKCRLYVNYMRRSDPGVSEIKQRLSDNLIQSPIKGVVWYSKGLLHNGSHFFDLIRYWLGRMSSFTMINSERSINDVDAEPDFQIEFNLGSVTFLSAREEAFSHYTIELIAANGRLRYEQGGQHIYWQGVIQNPLIKNYKCLGNEQIIKNRMTHSQLNVLTQLKNDLCGEHADICYGVEALDTLRSLSLIVQQSARMASNMKV